MAKKPQLTLKQAEEADLQALYGILALAGEHMHRTLDLGHWYPFRTFERFLEITDREHIYAIFADDLLIATFNLASTPRSYYRLDMWTDSNHRALYLGGVGVLPSHQGMGIGKWMMQEVERICQELEIESLRFDAVANHSRLLAFYDRLGYQRRAYIPIDDERQLIAFEHIFLVE